MACYDCEYCSNSSFNGGKCERFEYDCPFLAVKNYDAKKLSQIRSIIEHMSESIEKLKELDDGDYLYDETSAITFNLTALEDKTSQNIENEWNKINQQN